MLLLGFLFNVHYSQIPSPKRGYLFNQQLKFIAPFMFKRIVTINKFIFLSSLTLILISMVLESPLLFKIAMVLLFLGLFIFALYMYFDE